ncbi:hypothetical protein ml_55 [Mollivirus sibericum]|uniref:hypothetical protein n=1 Tax=Mollivirus sibericum TaxID=1678078 RepID=UPI0006B2D974|nr:hypothetical protein ml_55 [Mollivirus sibericum]ALD61857.1 hypothetical protein ml_55 [Mollivirus sibericum]
MDRREANEEEISIDEIGGESMFGGVYGRDLIDDEDDVDEEHEDTDSDHRRLHSSNMPEFETDISAIEAPLDEEVEETMNLLERMAMPGVSLSEDSRDSSRTDPREEPRGRRRHNRQRKRGRDAVSQQQQHHETNPRHNSNLDKSLSQKRHKADTLAEDDSRQNHTIDSDVERHHRHRHPYTYRRTYQGHRQSPLADVRRSDRPRQSSKRSKSLDADVHPFSSRKSSRRRSRTSTQSAKVAKSAKVEIVKIDLEPLDGVFYDTDVHTRPVCYFPLGPAKDGTHAYDALRAARSVVDMYVGDVTRSIAAHARPDTVVAVISSSFQVSHRLLAAFVAVLNAESRSLLLEWVALVDDMAHRLYRMVGSPYATNVALLWRHHRMATRVDSQQQRQDNLFGADAFLPPFGCLLSAESLARAISTTTAGCTELAVMTADRVLSIERAAFLISRLKDQAPTYNGQLPAFHRIFTRQVRIQIERVDTSLLRFESPFVVYYEEESRLDESLAVPTVDEELQPGAGSSIDDVPCNGKPENRRLVDRLVATSRLSLIACLANKCRAKERPAFAMKGLSLADVWLSSDYVKALSLPAGTDSTTKDWLNHPLGSVARACLSDISDTARFDPVCVNVANVALGILESACKDWCEVADHPAYDLFHGASIKISAIVLDCILRDLMRSSTTTTTATTTLEPIEERRNEAARLLICGSTWMLGSASKDAHMASIIRDWRDANLARHGQQFVDEAVARFDRSRNLWGVQWMASNATETCAVLSRK